MPHIVDDRIYDLALPAGTATAQESAHLDACDQCRTALAEMTELLADLRLHMAATPDPATLDRYYALADEIVPAPSLAARMWEAVSALLAWDSRTQLVGTVRSAAAADYRLLYTTEHADIEMMVSHTGNTRRIEGEYIPRNPAVSPAAMIELEGASVSSGLVATSRPDGRFRLDAVVPGDYRITVVPVAGQLHVIDQLEIS